MADLKKTMIKAAMRPYVFYKYRAKRLRFLIRPEKLNDRTLAKSLRARPGRLEEAVSKAARDINPLPLYSDDAENVIRILREKFPDAVKRAVEEADFALANRFTVHELEHYAAGDPVLWNRDPRSGGRWNESALFPDPAKSPPGADIKMPWELSRFAFLFPLGIAYRTTGDERYADKFVGLVSDWIDRNPYGRGVNWTCAMEAAFRAAAWLFAFPLVRTSPAASTAFLKKFIGGIRQHGIFIIDNLEGRRTLKTNHYLSDVTGLLVIAASVPGLRESRAWLDFSSRELKREMMSQVNPDGTGFEASICYHRLSLELFTTGYLVGREAGLRFPDEFTDRLENMFSAAHGLLDARGTPPQIGDNDSGRLWNFTVRDPLDFSYLVPLGALLFNKSEWKSAAFPVSPEPLWLLGPGAADSYNRWPDSPDSRTSALFSDAGWVVIRRNDVVITVSSGTIGQNGTGGHSHNDKLSFDISAGGVRIIADPGTFIYTPDPDERNRFRSTASHNTVEIDSEEQSRFVPGNLFALRDNPSADIISFIDSPDKIEFEGVHYGYERLPDPVTHRRAIEWPAGVSEISVTDELDCSGEHAAVISFHLGPGVKPVLTSKDNKILLEHGGGTIAELYSDDSLKPAIENSFYSAGYGAKTPVRVIRFRKSFTGKSVFKFKIRILEQQDKEN